MSVCKKNVFLTSLIVPVGGGGPMKQEAYFRPNYLNINSAPHNVYEQL